MTRAKNWRGKQMKKPNYRSDLIDVEVDVVHQTPKAIKLDTGFRDDNDKPIVVWIPKSLCELDRDSNVLTISETLAKDKGLI